MSQHADPAPTTSPQFLDPDQRERLEEGELILDTSKLRKAKTNEVSIEGILDCPPEKIYEVLTDYDTLPEVIAGLDGAEVLEKHGPEHSRVRFTMKLPFPIGTIEWENDIEHIRGDDRSEIAWSYRGGDFSDNTGRMLLYPYGDGQTFAHYDLTVEARTRIPSIAHRVGLRWLLPKVVERLRQACEAR